MTAIDNPGRIGQTVRRGIMCETCGTDSAVEVTISHDGADVATLVGCQRCRTGICANAEGD